MVNRPGSCVSGKERGIIAFTPTNNCYCPCRCTPSPSYIRAKHTRSIKAIKGVSAARVILMAEMPLRRSACMRCVRVESCFRRASRTPTDRRRPPADAMHNNLVVLRADLFKRERAERFAMQCPGSRQRPWASLQTLLKKDAVENDRPHGP